MLEYLRNAADKPVAKILIGILAFSFVGWGVAEWIFGNVLNDTSLVTVGDADITAEQFNMEKSRQLAAMTREQQRATYTDPAAAREFQNRVLTTLVTQQIAENRANDLGFIVTDRRIAREIREFPEFQSEGKFSPLLFDTVLRNSGYSEASFARVLRGQVLRSMVLGAASIPMNVPRFAATAMYNARYGERNIEYATVRFSDFKTGTPSDAQLRDFYAQNPKTIPEFRTASYIIVPADMARPDKYDAAYAIAQSIEDDIIAGETMAHAASRHGGKYVSLRPFSADKRPADKNLSDGMIEKIFAMDAGTESEIIETPNGFIIIRLESVEPSHTAEYDSVKSGLADAWRRDQQRRAAYVRANELLVDLNENGKLAGKQSAKITRASGAPTDILVAAFNSPVGTNSIIPGANAFYVLSVKSESAPRMDTKKMSGIYGELKNISARYIMDDYNSFLMREYPAQINHKVYNRFFGE